MTGKRGGSGKSFSGADFVIDNPAGSITIESPPFETIEDVDIYLSQYKLICLECGGKYINLGCHITGAHNYMNSRDYKRKYNIPYSRALWGFGAMEDMRRRAKERLENAEYKAEWLAHSKKANAKRKRVGASQDKHKQDAYSTNRRISNGVKTRLKKSRPKYLEVVKLAVSKGITITEAIESVDGVTQGGMSRYAKDHPKDKEVVNLYSQVLENRKYTGFTEEQVRRGLETRRVNQKAITHCPKGHPYSGDNLYISKKGCRSCKECTREAKRRFRKRQKADA